MIDVTRRPRKLAPSFNYLLTRTWTPEANYLDDMATRYVQIDISHLQDPKMKATLQINHKWEYKESQKRPDIPTPLGANKYASM